MELALNLIWLCLALAGFALLGSNLSRHAEPADRRPTNRQKIVAMSCALIILFFVVSMTDDLHDQEVLVEDSKFLRAMSATGSPSLAAGHATITLHFLLYFGVTPSSFAFSLPAVRRLLEPLVVSFTGTLCSRSLQGRAPPTLPA